MEVLGAVHLTVPMGWTKGEISAMSVDYGVVPAVYLMVFKGNVVPERARCIPKRQGQRPDQWHSRHHLRSGSGIGRDKVTAILVT